MVSRLDTQATLALDTQNLEQLRTQARQSPDQALKAAAQQFESVFLNMMLKSMRDATPQDGMFDSEQTRMFTGMLDQQLAQSMSSRGIGLADIMVKQLSRAQGKDSSLPLPGGMISKTENPGQDFVRRMLPHAEQAEKESGFPAKLILGQAVLESGWGKREIKMVDGSSSYNLFGIKADSGWKGKVAEVMTTEYIGGQPCKKIDRFRAYSSYSEAFQDYARTIGRNPRYASVMRQDGDLSASAHALQDAGYATDPDYAQKLTRVLDSLSISARAGS